MSIRRETVVVQNGWKDVGDGIVMPLLQRRVLELETEYIKLYEGYEEMFGKLSLGQVRILKHLLFDYDSVGIKPVKICGKMWAHLLPKLDGATLKQFRKWVDGMYKSGWIFRTQIGWYVVNSVRIYKGTEDARRFSIELNEKIIVAWITKEDNGEVADFSNRGFDIVEGGHKWNAEEASCLVCREERKCKCRWIGCVCKMKIGNDFDGVKTTKLFWHCPKCGNLLRSEKVKSDQKDYLAGIGSVEYKLSLKQARAIYKGKIKMIKK